MVTWKAAAEYCAKYASKAEVKSKSLTEIALEVVPYVNDRRPAKSLTAKLINRLIGERDISAQEVSHTLLQLDMMKASRQYIVLDCRREQDQQIRIEVGDNLAVKTSLSAYKRYKLRLQKAPEAQHAALEDLTLLEWLTQWDHHKFKARKANTPPRVLYFFPQYSSEPTGEAYEDYCRVKMMLSHAFIDEEDLLNVNGIECETWQEAFSYCELLHHNHNDDFYDPIPALSDEVNDDSDAEYDFQEEEDEPIELQDHEAFARIRPGRDDASRVITANDLGSRDLDREYNWSAHIGRFDVPITYWDTIKA